MDTKFDRKQVEEAIKLLKNFEMYAEISKLDVNEKALYQVSATLISICQQYLDGTLDRPMMSAVCDCVIVEAGCKKCNGTALIGHIPAPEKSLSKEELIGIIEESKAGDTLQNHYLVFCDIPDREMYEAIVKDLADAILTYKPAPENICPVHKDTKCYCDPRPNFFEKEKVCPNCGGGGYHLSKFGKRVKLEEGLCPICKGRGLVATKPIVSLCETCRGTGKVGGAYVPERDCPKCQGTGHIPPKEEQERMYKLNQELKCCSCAIPMIGIGGDKECLNCYKPIRPKSDVASGLTKCNICGLEQPYTVKTDVCLGCLKKKSSYKPNVASEFPPEIKDIGIDLIDDFFPKNKCKERGQAIVLYAELIIRFQKLMAERNKSVEQMTNHYYETLEEYKAEIARLNEKVSALKKATGMVGERFLSMHKMERDLFCENEEQRKEIARLNEALSDIATGKHPQKRCVEIAGRGLTKKKEE